VASIMRTWRPQAVIDATLAQLERNGSVVGKFVEGEAKARLLAIGKPDNKRAVAYRAYLARYVLTYNVRREKRAVVIEVGMRAGSGKKGMMRGFYIEIGSRTAPATSFLRRAVLENQATILATLGGR